MTEKDDRKSFSPTWFKFAPANWIAVTTLTNFKAGARFKQMLANLLSGEAPEGTEEARMIEEARRFSERQRDRVNAYWKTRRPDPKPAAGNGTEPPTLDEVYDVCAVAGIDPDTGREFFDWMNRKNLWSGLQKPWNFALRGFARRKAEQREQRNQNQKENQG